MAPLAKRRKKALAAAPPPPPPPPVIHPADRLSQLPPEIQAQILSFLPGQEAVRSCVLARSWRHVWRFTRRLLITGRSVEEVCEFVDRMLRVRRDGLKLASLDATEIRFDPFVDVDWKDEENVDLSPEDEETINRWIRRVLKCQMRTLRVDISARTSLDVYLRMSTRPFLVSRHLTRLELTGVWFIGSCINLDGCPELEHLEINECCLENVRKISSLSLKRLVMTSYESNSAPHRIQICVPRLVSFLLDDMDCRAPLLEIMPELVEAKVQINSFDDRCCCDDPMACYHITRDGDTSEIDSDSDDGDTSEIDSDSDDSEEGSGDYAGQNTTKCLVLEGLAQAKDLELIASDDTYIFRRDLRWCPTFFKLKTLVLNHDCWCQPTDCSALACILEHAPLLEKLTLIPYQRRYPFQRLPTRGKYKVEMKGYPDATMKSTKISQHLKIVEIKCEDVNERLLNVLSFLGTLNICFDI